MPNLGKNYVIVKPDPVEELMMDEDMILGHEGGILLKLIKENKPHLYQELLVDKKERERLWKSIDTYVDRMITSIGNGLKEFEAREIHWPDLVAEWGFR